MDAFHFKYVETFLKKHHGLWAEHVYNEKFNNTRIDSDDLHKSTHEYIANVFQQLALIRLANESKK